MAVIIGDNGKGRWLPSMGGIESFKMGYVVVDARKIGI